LLGFDSKLLSLIQELKDKYKEVVFIGDFNTREIDWNTWTSKSELENHFLDILRDYSGLPLTWKVREGQG
jgi:exonuclease III